MVTAPAPIPFPGVCQSQVASWLTPQRSVLLPVLLTVKVWAGGLLSPCCAVKDRLAGVMLIVDATGAAVTVKETGIVTGVTPVPPLRVTVPVWVPAAKAPVVACKVTVPLPLPVPALRVNQPVFSFARPVQNAAAVLLMLSVCAAGLLPPSVAVNARLVGLAAMAGTGAAVTVKETGIVTGVAPGALRVMVSL